MASQGEDKGAVHWHKGCWEVLQRGPRCRQGYCPGSTTKQVKEVPVACDLTGKRAARIRTSHWTPGSVWWFRCHQCHSSVTQIYRWLYPPPGDLIYVVNVTKGAHSQQTGPWSR